MSKHFWVTFNVSGDISYLIEAETSEEAQEQAQERFALASSPDSFNLHPEGNCLVEEEGDDA